VIVAGLDEELLGTLLAIQRGGDRSGGLPA
jgi:hypothetical protein